MCQRYSSEEKYFLTFEEDAKKEQKSYEEVVIDSAGEIVDYLYVADAPSPIETSENNLDCAVDLNANKMFDIIDGIKA